MLGKELRSWEYLESLHTREPRSYPKVSKHILVKISKVGDLRIDFFLMIPWYIVPFFPLKSRRASGFLAPQKNPYFWERVYIAWKKSIDSPRYFWKYISLSVIFVPNEFADFCIICFHHFITRFTQQLHVLPVASSCCLRGTPSSSTSSQAGCEKVVFGEWKHTFLKRETSIY